MAIQFNRPTASTTVNARKRPARNIELDEDGNVTDLINDIMPEKPRAGFLKQLAGLAHALLPGQTAKVTVTTVEIHSTPPRQEMPSLIQTKVMPYAVSPASASVYEPIGKKTVIRVMARAANQGKLRNCHWNEYASGNPDTRRLPDGTTMVILIDYATGFKHGWTICPETHEPHYLGWVNE